MASPEGVAARFVDGMDQDTQEEFARIAAEAMPYRPGHLKVAEGMIKSHVEMLFTSRGKATWQVPAQPRPAPEKLILSENNKEHLKIIVAAQVSDMMPAIQRLVAADPRIQRFSLSNSPRFKELIIKRYKEDLAARRKSEISLLRTASKLSQANVSSQAYRAIRNILVDMGFREVLPVWKDLDEARKTIEKCANEDLQLTATEDGWFVSPTAAVELDFLRRLQMTSSTGKNTRRESGARLIGFAGPGMHGWQDERTVKITLDARSITKKTSHTDFSMQTFDEGEAGEAESHRALGLRTLGVWMGKDSREKVQVNTPNCFKEIQQLAEHGVVFNRELQTFLGQAKAFREMSELEQQAVCEDGKRKYCPVKIKFVFCGDMAALCAVFGHGCAGNHFCGHCMAHEEDRHLPYVLFTTDEEISLQAMAHKYDMHARTLYAINTRQDHKGVQILTAEGLRNSTAMDAVAREAAARAEMQRQAADSEADGVSRRARKRARKVPVANSEPDEAVLKKLVGWKQNHRLDCSCCQCVIPKGTCVRVVPRIGFNRPSAFLEEHCPALTPEMCPFCALHCNMRVTETLFYQICQAALTSSKRLQLIERMNTALRDLGINRSYKESLDTKKYEKISFEGHQCWDLLETGPDGKMGIEHVLEAMWPGAAEDTDVGKSAYGTKFVPRTIEVWRQWAVVVKLMSERFSDKLKKDVVDGEDGFARFGKECREFIFRFQAMSTVDYSKAYYLHTLLHHAGDLMRALQKVGLTLGMMSNSAAERRHEYGRRASRKALASNGWRNKSKEYATMPNLLVYITVKEMLMWEYGSDLVSHEIARRCAEEDWPGEPALLDGRRVKWTIAPRRTLLSASGNENSKLSTTQAGSGEESDLHSERLSEEQLPLLSEDEVRKEFEAGPNAPPPSFETENKKIWGERDKTKAFALIGLQCEGDLKEGKFDPDLQGALFDGQPVYVTDDESVAGSEEDLHLTLDSFDFPEQDEDEDASFVILEGAEEQDLEAEPLEWEMPKGGKTGPGPDAHAGSESAQPEAAQQRTLYARLKKPTQQAAAAPVATGSPRRLVQPTPGFAFVPVGSTSDVVRAQPSQPSDFTFMGSMSGDAMAPGYANSFGGARRPASQAAKGRSVRGQRGRGRGGRDSEGGGRPGGNATQTLS